MPDVTQFVVEYPAVAVLLLLVAGGFLRTAVEMAWRYITGRLDEQEEEDKRLEAKFNAQTKDLKESLHSELKDVRSDINRVDGESLQRDQDIREYVDQNFPRNERLAALDDRIDNGFRNVSQQMKEIVQQIRDLVNNAMKNNG